ncbi:DUF803-domain-containing protein [Polychaeton citri CBS 116435]|uniref:DUF803-domain-containing protein n=1 Tax=Polychaeton citri CBS 116435 TaxID=1314669 RepID=A0A9P4UUR5_9PEZI|nr:DUF803-domain-containing protein [Polychaeton citri CBS 116435]
MIEDKYVGLALAVTSTLGIGASFVITKKGLNAAAESDGFEGEGFQYLRNPIWWAGIITMVVGEICNFSAYAFAPAILVTPLGALSVLIGAVLGSYFLDERLGVLGRIGCATCLVGSVVIVLHAPPDEELESIDQLLGYALRLPFMIYTVLVTIFAFVMIYRIAPRYGKLNPMVYLSICSTVGSISIMAIKGFGIALKMTLNGNNQFTSASTYVFIIVVVVCILTQMNYFNKALSQFSTNIVNPLYYVTFTTFTLLASFILFGGFNTTDAVNTISLLCGFLTIFSGVYLLNLSREDPDGTGLGIASSDNRGKYHEVDGIPTDGLTGLQTRLSMQNRRSGDFGSGSWNGDHRRSRSWSLRSPTTFTSSRERLPGVGAGDQHLMHSYEIENGGLGELAEDSDEDSGPEQKRTSFDNNGVRRPMNGGGEGSSFGLPRRSRTIESETVAMGGKSFDRIR